MEITIQQNSQYGLVVSSRTIAKELGKQHQHVIRDLEKILISPNVDGLIFLSNYKDSRNRTYKEYLLTKDGFTLYMFNIQGYNDFKMAYIQKFNEMERLINQREHIFNGSQRKLNYSNDFIPTYQERAISTKRMIDKEIKNIEKELKIIQDALMNIKAYEAGIKLYMLQI